MTYFVFSRAIKVVSLARAEAGENNDLPKLFITKSTWCRIKSLTDFEATQL